MLRTLIAFGWAGFLAWPAVAQEIGTVRFVAPSDARHYVELCQRSDGPPDCRLRSVANHYCAIRIRSVADPPCCIPDSEATNAHIRSSFLAWAEANAERLDEDVNVALRQALSRSHPCTPELLAAIPVLGENFLFPQGGLSSDPGLDQLLNDWWSRQLGAMGEGALGLRAGEDAEIYRMLVVPTWSPSYAVRIERVGLRTTVDHRVLDGAGGYDPGTLARSQHFVAALPVWEQLSQHLSDAEFYGAPAESPVRSTVRDGTMWVLEGMRDGRYHVVYRRLPDELNDLGRISDFIHALVDRPPVR